MDAEQSEVLKFYKNQTIFITGGTGYVGKVLIEKLLRVCDVRRINILVRSKKGKNPQERFQSLFDFPCFDQLKSLKIDFASKVSLIDGDCQKLSLGLSSEDQEVLKKETTCFIHAAANVRFDQSLRVAASNARSLRDSLHLAKHMPKLKAFVFVSTAYSNCIHPYIGEKFYEPPMTADELFTLLEETSDEMLEKVTPRLLGQYPNTYIFTKCIAENILKQESDGLPVVIIRPAIVTSTVDEPMPGWIDNLYGVNGIVTAAALGVLRSLHATLDAQANLVPCDFVSNVILASAWHIHKQATKRVEIINYVGSKKSPLTWRMFIQEIENCAWDYCSEKLVWYYCFALRENYYWHRVCVFFLHTVVAYIVDFFLIMTGKEPLAVKNYSRLDTMLSYISYFSINFWMFGTKNLENLWHNMGEVDRKIFNFDSDNVNVSEYARDAVKGGRLYLLKDTMDTIPQGFKKMRMLQVAHYSILTILAILLIRFGMFLFRIIF